MRVALKDLDPVNFRVWPGWAAMIDRLQTKRPIVFVSAPTETSLRVTSDRGSQPMFGLKAPLVNLCEIKYSAPGVYTSDSMTADKWLEFQGLMTFWGVVIQPEAPLALNSPQVFPLAPQPPAAPPAAAPAAIAPGGSGGAY